MRYHSASVCAKEDGEVAITPRSYTGLSRFGSLALIRWSEGEVTYQ